MATTSQIAALCTLFTLVVSASFRAVSGETPTISIANHSGRQITLYAYRNAADCSGGAVPMGKFKLLDSGTSTTHALTSGEPFSFFINYLTMSAGQLKYCNVPATFVPQAGRSYAVTFQTTSSQCALGLAYSSGEPLEEQEAFRLREWKQPFGSKGSFCKVEPE